MAYAQLVSTSLSPEVQLHSLQLGLQLGTNACEIAAGDADAKPGGGLVGREEVGWGDAGASRDSMRTMGPVFAIESRNAEQSHHVCTL